MSGQQPTSQPAIDTIPKVDNAVSVGEDLQFQRAWWRFEWIAWLVLILILIADGLGVFGRGWLARAEKTTSDGTLHLRYERVERAGTPSEMSLEFGPAAEQGGKIRLFSSRSIVKGLGAQRIIPQPEISEIGPGGITYTFAASGSPAFVSIALQPSFPGVHEFELKVGTSEPIKARILVLP